MAKAKIKLFQNMVMLHIKLKLAMLVISLVLLILNKNLSQYEDVFFFVK